MERKAVVMPLSFANVGEENIVKKVGGKAEVRAHLENLGFVAGAAVTVITSLGGNIIVRVKGSRVAISREMAGKIIV
ncbi:FeoA family protein [Anaeromassilibacillus senegalensis]|nr:FeoA family protein [Anaeromassilibacillus senegalensis]